MIRFRPLHNFPGCVLPLAAGVVTALALLATVPVRSAQNPAPFHPGEVLSPPTAVNNQAAVSPPNQQGEPKKSNLERTKTDAAELSALADQLRDELNKTNPNVFSLEVIQKIKKIEKLAKKIKGEANGH